MYKERTRDIRVTVKPFYLEDQSAPEEDHYVWAYHVKIENTGLETVQLRTRYWYKKCVVQGLSANSQC